MSSPGVTTGIDANVSHVKAPDWREFYHMETAQLLARWLVLLNQPGNVIVPRDVLQERLDILHRLNELGTRIIDGVSIFTAMEATNALMRRIARAGAA